MQYLAGLTNKFSNEPSKKVSEAAIQWLAPKLAFFKKEDAMFKRILAECHMAQDNPWDSYKLMGQIKYDELQEVGDDEEPTPAHRELATEKVRDYVTACDYCFEAKEPTTGEQWINRAAHLMHMTDDPELNWGFKYLKAKVANSNRKFQQAAQDYYRMV